MRDHKTDSEVFPEDPSSPHLDETSSDLKEILIFVSLSLLTLFTVSFSVYIIAEKYF